MKKSYEAIILECVCLSDEDILTASEGMSPSNGFDTPYDAF